MHLSSKEVKQGKAQKQEEKPQLKEHCSKKASNCIRNLALGLMVAAGVASTVAKPMPVQAAEANSPVNPTSISEQAEVNAEKTDVEMMVDEAIEEQTYSNIHIGGKVTCEGEMRNLRNYDQAQITPDGQLVFIGQDVKTEFKTGYQMNYNGNFEYCTKLDTDTKYSNENSFNLGANASNSTIKLQPGTKFSEEVEKNGDYVQLAEDGKTFNVYDSSGKNIGCCKFMTDEEYAEAKDAAIESAKVTGVVVGSTVAVGGAVVAISKKIKNSKS